MSMVSENKRWQRESDAHTLAEAEAIKADKARLAGAAQAAKKMADDRLKSAKEFTKVANKVVATNSKANKGKK